MSVPRLSTLPAAIRSVPVRRSSLRSALIALAALAIAALAIAAGTAAAAAAPSPSPSRPARVHTASADAGLVDRAAYPDKNAVHLLASRCIPDDGQVPAGEYVFGVLTDGARLLSTDSAAARRIYIDQAGRISSSSETHAGHAIFCGDGTYFTTVPISPFDDAPSPDAPYQLVVASRAAVDACLAAGDPSGFGCADVHAMAVTFRVDQLESLPPSPTASPSVSPAPAESGSPEPSGSLDPSQSSSPAPSGSDAGPGGSPAATATPAASPSPTPAATTAAPPQTPQPNPGGGSAGGNPARPPGRTPAPTPYVIPSGYLDCPGQIVTPSGCKPIDWEPSIPGQTPQPSWSWGAAPTGVPVFPGVNTPTPTPGTGGAVTAPPGSPGSSALGPVQAGVDIGGSASPSSAPVPGSSFGASNGASATAGATAVAGGVAGITSGPSGAASAPAQPVPTAATAPSSRPALPTLLAVLMLALVGAAAAAIVGWARRGVGRRAGTEH